MVFTLSMHDVSIVNTIDIVRMKGYVVTQWFS